MATAELRLPGPPARRWRWSHSRDTWRCWRPRAPSCGSPCRSARGKTPCRFCMKTFWRSRWGSWRGRGRLEVRCSARKKNNNNNIQEDFSKEFLHLCGREQEVASSLPPLAAKLHQRAPRSSRTCRFSGFLLQKSPKSEPSDCLRSCCKHNYQVTWLAGDISSLCTDSSREKEKI